MPKRKWDARKEKRAFKAMSRTTQWRRRQKQRHVTLATDDSHSVEVDDNVDVFDENASHDFEENATADGVNTSWNCESQVTRVPCIPNPGNKKVLLPGL